MSVFGKYPLLPLKRVSTINDDSLSENTSADYELQYIDIGNVDSNGAIREIVTHRFEGAPSRARRIVRHGDVIISTVRTYLQAITQINNPPDNLVVSTGFAVVRPNPKLLDTSYCKYALREPLFLYKVVSRSVGVSYPAITSLDLADISIFVPPLHQQRAIADYLDRETARIDSLIAAKERLLDLLAEKRRSVITHAATRGLNPDVALRDSGVEWLGEIPSHWKVDIVKRHFDVDLGKMLDSSKQKNEMGESMPYLRAANVFWDGPWLEDVNEMIFTPAQLERYRLRRGDLLVTEGGVTVGRSMIWQAEINPCYYQNSLNRVRTKGTVPTKFLYYWLYFLKLNNYIDIVSEKATFGHLTKEKLEVIPMTVPPQVEAVILAEYLDFELEKISRTEDKVKEAINLLRERRAALIAAAVSGQIKVTG